MFEKSRRKIVASIMAVLALLWIGTLAVIYGSSYHEVLNRNRELLERHVMTYVPGPPYGSSRHFDGARVYGAGSPPFADMSVFRLSTFYSVVFDRDENVMEIKNTPEAVYSDDSLENLARQAMESGREAGVTGSLVYRVADRGDYTLVAFMDNTIIQESMTTLFRYTLIFGGCAMAALFFLAVYLAGKIVTPLEQSYQKQKQFISDAGHELKTPVAIVSANAELLSREIGRNQWLSNIQYETGRMGVLVGQLLELARTEDVAVLMEPVDMGRLVCGETLPFESIAYEKGCMLCCDVEGFFLVKGNSAQLKQLTAILLDNAVRHCRQGGEVAVSLQRERNDAVLSVTNEGDEISDDVKEQIFERFYRADGSRNSEGNHYGLGLAIAKAIAEAHHGKIAVRCCDGRVEFTVRIPLVR